MPKITDQEFDDLFRNAANRISTEPDASDWEDMQRRLEAAERDARARNISLYSLVVILLLYGLFVPEDLKFRSSQLASVVPATEQPRETGASDLGGISAVDVTRGQAQLPSPGGSDADEEERPVNKRSGQDEAMPYTRSHTGGKRLDGNHDPALDASLSGKSRRELNGNTDAAASTPAVKPTHELSSTAASVNGTETKPEVHEARSAGASVSGTELKRGTHELSSEAPSTDNAITRGTFEVRPLGVKGIGSEAEPAAGTTVTVSTAPLYAVPQADPEPVPLRETGRVVAAEGPQHRPWSIKVSVAPDLTSINYGGTGKTGFNFGPVVEYGISSRLSVSTGAIWSKKLYDQKDPEKTYGQGGNTIKANSLEGDCRILDVPLNVTYYLFPARRTNLFVTAGASSYLMMDEKYVYTVSRNYHDYDYVETYSSNNMEWFSMLNFSVGVQYQLARKWFIQGEPFLKAPVKGVGKGKVNLVSTGVFVSVKYRLNP